MVSHAAQSFLDDVRGHQERTRVQCTWVTRWPMLFT